MLDVHQLTLRDRFAEEAIELWGQGFALTHIADSGNSVYQADRPGGRYVLRLTNPAYRTAWECQGELDFILHAASKRCRVATPIPSREGNLVEVVRNGDTDLIASLFRWAPGTMVTPSDRNWNRSFLEEWGRSLGELHRAAKSFVPSPSGSRWHWHDEILIAKAAALIPEEQTHARALFAEVIDAIRELPIDADSYGITHGDFAPQNFRFDPINGITSFDFGNCCNHFFASDIAIAFTALRRRSVAEQAAAREAILEGYLQINHLGDAQLATIPLMHRLRVHYVYLSRLYKFGSNPTDDERTTLASLREWVRAEG